MELEIVNKLYLEMSQFATVVSKKEADLKSENATLRQQLEDTKQCYELKLRESRQTNQAILKSRSEASIEIINLNERIARTEELLEYEKTSNLNNVKLYEMRFSELEKYCLEIVSITKKMDERVSRLVTILKKVDEWRGLDGDGITDPLMTDVKKAIANG
jgi:hypothetical protein